MSNRSGRCHVRKKQECAESKTSCHSKALGSSSPSHVNERDEFVSAIRPQICACARAVRAGEVWDGRGQKQEWPAESGPPTLSPREVARSLLSNRHFPVFTPRAPCHELRLNLSPPSSPPLDISPGGLSILWMILSRILADGLQSFSQRLKPLGHACVCCRYVA